MSRPLVFRSLIVLGLCLVVLAGLVVSHVVSRPPPALTANRAVGYAIRDAQQVKPGFLGCVLRGLPTQINGAQLPHHEARQLLDASPDSGSGDNRLVWLIVLRGDIGTQTSGPATPATPQSVTFPPPATLVYQQIGVMMDVASVDADRGDLHLETTCRPTTREIPTGTLPVLPQPQGTLPVRLAHAAHRWGRRGVAA